MRLRPARNLRDGSQAGRCSRAVGTLAFAAASATTIASGLAACRRHEAPSPSDTVTASAGQPAESCPTAPVEVVASIEQWGAVVRAVAGGCARVTTIVSGTSGDPHEFEPRPADVAAFARAQFVVANGLGYDDWATRAATTARNPPTVLDAGALAGRHAGDDPHLWYSPKAVADVAAAIARELQQTADTPGTKAYLGRQAGVWRNALDRVTARIAVLRTSLAGKRVLATEPVYNDTIAALGMVDVTPAGFRQAVANGGEPAPADVHAFEDVIVARSVDLLVVNVQTASAITDSLRSRAAAAGVPVLEITETLPPSAHGGFVDWQLAELDSLATAMGRS